MSLPPHPVKRGPAPERHLCHCGHTRMAHTPTGACMARTGTALCPCAAFVRKTQERAA